MLKLYYDGWRDVGHPITIGKIKKFSFLDGEDVNSVINSWVGDENYVTPRSIGASLCDIEEGSGFRDFTRTYKSNITKELFTDPDLSDSTGIYVEKITTGYSFTDGEHTLYGIPNPPAVHSIKAYELCSMYDGDTFNDFLKSIATQEKNIIKNNGIVAHYPLSTDRGIPAMSISPLACPFVLHVISTIGVGENLITYNTFSYIGRTASKCLSFATLYKCYYKKNLVQADVMTGNGYEGIEPSVAYNPANIIVKNIGKDGVDGCYSYDDDIDNFNLHVPEISNARQDDLESVSDIVVWKEEETTFKYKDIDVGNVALTVLPFVQKGTVVNVNVLKGTKTKIPDVFDNKIFLRTDSDDWLDKPRSLSTYEYIYNDDNTFLIETVALWNVSKVLKESPEVIFGLIGKDNKLPLFVVAGDSTEFNSTGKYNVFNVACNVAFSVSENEFTHITGEQYSRWFYNGSYVDAGDKPMPPSDIPPDNGNGGFNNQDYIGGDGVWNDTTVDMTPDRDNPIWNIPHNLGLDGNYTIVKLNRSAVESLASQTWTENSWLAYALKFAGTSRTADGIADIKTCFCDIPSKGNASVTAIAGYGIKEPLPCSLIDQYNEFNMGTVNVPKYFGSFLDYSPYTEIVLELPFAQPVKIPPEVAVGHSVGVKLFVDVMSDTAMYLVHCDGRLIAQVPANIFITLPFGASEFTQSALGAVSGYIANAGGIGGRVGSSDMQGQNALVAAGKAAMRIASKANPVGLIVEGIQMASGAVNKIVEMESSRKITQISEGGGAGAVGAMGVKYAVLKISRPYVTIPPRYYELNGCPSGFVKKIGDCKGYLEVGAIYGSIKCNTEEFSMITEVLSSGVFP